MDISVVLGGGESITHEERIATHVMRVYLANAFFSAADHAFNLSLRSFLEGCGWEVFAPQGSDHNAHVSPRAIDIFRADTRELIRSSVVVACLDAECIDAGVACEIGIAYSFGVPIIGLLTDSRQFRTGAGKIYKNLFVIGAIERTGGEVVSNFPSLAEAIKRRGQGLGPRRWSARGETADIYDSFVGCLEEWYNPPWTSWDALSPYIDDSHPLRVLEFGCGTGRFARRLFSERTVDLYVGCDSSRSMLNQARRHVPSLSAVFHHNLHSAGRVFGERGANLVVAHFVLHDAGTDQFLDVANDVLIPGGSLCITDVTILDLPRLASSLRHTLVSPAKTTDSRIDPLALADDLDRRGFHVEALQVATPSITFPEADSVLQFARLFQIDRGADLPLGIGRMAATGRRWLRKAIHRLSFPFTDRRAFITCVAKGRN